jgi:hypothetical protein
VHVVNDMTSVVQPVNLVSCSRPRPRTSQNSPHSTSQFSQMIPNFGSSSRKKFTMANAPAMNATQRQYHPRPRGEKFVRFVSPTYR